MRETAYAKLNLALHVRAREADGYHRLETLFAFADRLEARLQTAQTATERLTPALLAKAFRGELVPQDPADAPVALPSLGTTGAATPRPRRGRPSKTA